MRIQVRSREAGSRSTDRDEDPAERARVRLEFALARYARFVRSVVVRLSDENGPRGGMDRCCTVDVQLRAGAPVRVVQVASTWEGAVDLAADRAGYAVSRKLDRRRDLGRAPVSASGA